MTNENLGEDRCDGRSNWWEWRWQPWINGGNWKKEKQNKNEINQEKKEIKITLENKTIQKIKVNKEIKENQEKKENKSIQKIKENKEIKDIINNENIIVNAENKEKKEKEEKPENKINREIKELIQLIFKLTQILYQTQKIQKMFKY